MTEVRASSLSGYVDCPRRWMARQHAGLVESAGYSLNRLGRHIGSATGQATHQGALSGVRERIKSGTFDAEAMDDIAVATLHEETTDHEVIWDDRTPNVSVAERQVLRQVAVYRESVLPTDETEFVEPAWEGDHHTGLRITGHPDQVSYRVLQDVKTGLQSFNAPQYGCYVMLSWVAPENVQVDRIEELFIPRTKITEAAPELERFEYELGLCVAVADRILVTIDRALKEFKNMGRSAFAANPQSMLCSNTFCPAWGTSFCPESTLVKR